MLQHTWSRYGVNGLFWISWSTYSGKSSINGSSGTVSKAFKATTSVSSSTYTGDKSNKYLIFIFDIL